MPVADLVDSFDLEYFFEQSPDLICIAGYNGYFRKVNAAVSEALGFSEEELLSKPIHTFVHPDDQEITLKSRESVRDDNLLLNFENRYISRDGDIVWLSWTTKLIKRDQLIFGIAKRITHPAKRKDTGSEIALSIHGLTNERLRADEVWLNTYKVIAKKYIGNMDVSVRLISDEMAMSERQVFRRVKRILGISPNKLLTKIRLEIAFDAIETGKYTTLSEIARIAGFSTPAYFGRLFKEAYNVNVIDLVNQQNERASDAG